jgi:hypothetical protein
VRRSLLALAAGLATLCWSADAVAQAAGATRGTVKVGCVSGQNGEEGVCIGEYLVTIDSLTATVSEATTSAVSDTQYIAYNTLDIDGGPNGDLCAAIGVREQVEPPGPPTVGSQLGGGVVDGLVRGLADCPVAPKGEEAPVAPETRQTYAVRFWQGIPLPHPEPYIAPGRAITGLLAYLETRGTTTHTYTEPNTPFGPLTVTATGKYYVDWGDGTRSGPHSREGKAWPEGEITHEYINVGVYDVVVTERWTATWNFGGESGTLDELRTVGTIEDFPVQQIQAVVLR